MSLPDNLNPRVEESGNEISLSIEETNRVRASLGLKPLTAGKSDAPRRPAEKPRDEVAERKKKTDELKERIARQRDQRRAEADKKVRTLGEADGEDDDMAAWVEKNRQIVEAKKRKAEEEEDEEPDKRRAADEDDEDDDDGPRREGRYSARELAGLKVKHDHKDLVEGETMILTLADRSILNEKGVMDEDADELENVLKAEIKKRDKAWQAAGKRAKPLFEEDGKKRGLLDKYDEEEEQMMEIDYSGSIAQAAAARQEEVKRRLADGLADLEGGNKLPSAAADYYTAEEMAAFTKPKKTKKKKLRQKDHVKEEEEAANVIATLEAEAEVAGTSNLGSRAERLAQRERSAREAEEKMADKAARFDNALAKANWASQALRPQEASTSSAPVVTEDADDELYLSLQRARRAALAKQQDNPPVNKLEEVAAQIIVKREEEESKKKGVVGAGGLEFNEASEFIRSIAVGGPEPKAGEDSSYMDVDDDKPAAAASQPAQRAAAKEAVVRPRGGWREAEEDQEMEAEPSAQPSETGAREAQPAADGATAISGERAVGRGLMGVLGILKEKGMLKEKVEWAGRINDRKQTTMQQLADVYTGGSSEDKIARDVEAALTQRDEFGRIMTPRERFRLQCYRFHGKGPSKNKIEKKTKRTLEEISQRKAATSDNKAAEANEALTKQLGVPHVVLSGKNQIPVPAKPGSRSKRQDPPPSKIYSLTPVLGGGMTPLTDPEKKVAAMLGIRKSDMPPPASKKPRT